MATYKDGVRYVVYYNGTRYVDSLTKPKCPNFDTLFSVYQTDHNYANLGDVELSNPSTTIANYSFWMKKGSDDWQQLTVFFPDFIGYWDGRPSYQNYQTLIFYTQDAAKQLSLKVTKSGFYDSDTLLLPESSSIYRGNLRFVPTATAYIYNLECEGNLTGINNIGYYINTYESAAKTDVGQTWGSGGANINGFTHITVDFLSSMENGTNYVEATLYSTDPIAHKQALDPFEDNITFTVPVVTVCVDTINVVTVNDCAKYCYFINNERVGVNVSATNPTFGITIQYGSTHSAGSTATLYIPAGTTFSITSTAAPGDAGGAYTFSASGFNSKSGSF